MYQLIVFFLVMQHFGKGFNMTIYKLITLYGRIYILLLIGLSHSLTAGCVKECLILLGESTTVNITEE